jgi:sulfur carrier protein ThiS
MRIEVVFPPRWREFLPTEDDNIIWHKGRWALCFQMEIEPETPLKEVLARLRFYEVKFPPGVGAVAVVNKVFRPWDTPLGEGDVVELILGDARGG